MIVKKVIKLIASLTPKWLFNFGMLFVRNKKARAPEKNIDLNLLSFDNGGSALVTKERAKNIKYNLKIIVPCYNAEPYINECVASIIRQKTKYNLLLVLVNDGSTDKTLELLQKYKSANVDIINKKNGGVASARNKCLETIDSDFVMFVDSDDCLLGINSIDNALDNAYKVKEENKNIVIEFKHSNKIIDAKERKRIKHISYTKLSGFCWGKLFSSDLFRNVKFPENYWFEDTVLSMMIYPLANKCYKCGSKIYFYRQNPNGYTSQSKISNKTIDTFYITKKLLQERRQLGLAEDSDFYFRFYAQTICNCVRLRNFSIDVQSQVFKETIKLFEFYNIRPTYRFKTLYRSLKKKNFRQYFKFCNLYSKMYLNL